MRPCESVIQSRWRVSEDDFSVFDVSPACVRRLRDVTSVRASYRVGRESHCSSRWQYDGVTAVLAIDYGPITHYAVFATDDLFYTDGRSGPSIVDVVLPKHPLACHGAALLHDLCGQSLGFSKAECNCVYSSITANCAKLGSAVAQFVLDVAPLWYGHHSNIWFGNDLSSEKYSCWTKRVNTPE